MTLYDVFNGDADGICALHQFRLAQPADAVLVTGTKRENRLLPGLPAVAGDQVLALDIALPGNRPALEQMLAAGVRVRYVDHHEPGELPAHPNLQLTIDTNPQTCTSVLVDQMLGGVARSWAIVGAFGDNMVSAANRLADALGIDAATRTRWRELGDCLNYNAYGVTEQDLIYPPAQLYRALSAYAAPDAFIGAEPHFHRLSEARHADLELACTVTPRDCGDGARLYRLPDADASRRVFGSFANLRASQEPDRVHAVLAPRADQPGMHVVSLRVPAGAATTAHAVCSGFGGGGRAKAAGIDFLDEAGIEALADTLARAFGDVAQQATG